MEKSYQKIPLKLNKQNMAITSVLSEYWLSAPCLTGNKYVLVMHENI